MRNSKISFIEKDVLEIEINENGINHPLYRSKDLKFNSPAFNFDEVVTVPKDAICLASNKISDDDLENSGIVLLLEKLQYLMGHVCVVQWKNANLLNL